MLLAKKKIRGLARGALSLLAVTFSATASLALETEFAFDFDASKLWPEGCEVAPILDAEPFTARCAIAYERGHVVVVDVFLGFHWFSRSELKGARVELRATELWTSWIENQVAASAPNWTERHYSKRVSPRVPSNKTAEVVLCVESEREFENRGVTGHEGVGYVTRSRWLICGERAAVIKQGAEHLYPAKLAVVGVREVYAPDLGHAPKPQFDRIVDEVFSAFTW